MDLLSTISFSIFYAVWAMAAAVQIWTCFIAARSRVRNVSNPHLIFNGGMLVMSTIVSFILVHNWVYRDLSLIPASGHLLLSALLSCACTFPGWVTYLRVMFQPEPCYLGNAVLTEKGNSQERAMV